MIEEVDRSLERWLRAAVPLPSGTADVGFDQPEKDWDARRSTPLVDLFLYSLSPSESRAATGSRLIQRPDGGLARERVMPILQARYLVSVWGGGPGVEHELLGRIVNLLAASKAIPAEHLGEGLRAVRPAPVISLAPDDATTLTQLWTALSVPPRAGVQLLVETPVGIPVATPAADPPRFLQMTARDRRAPAAYSQRRRVFGRTDPSMAGGRAVGRRGAAIIEDSGRYNVEADPGDEITIEPPEVGHG